jgi:hypothetical protein
MEGRSRREQVRLQAAGMFAHDADARQIARSLRVSTKSVHQWRRAWQDGGQAALGLDRRRREPLQAGRGADRAAGRGAGGRPGGLRAGAGPAVDPGPGPTASAAAGPMPGPARQGLDQQAQCPVTSKIPRRASLTCEEESVLSIFGRQRVRFARFVGRRAATRDNEVCLSGRLGDRFGRFPGCMNVSASRPSAAGRGKLSGRRRRSSTTNWQKGKFDVIGHPGPPSSHRRPQG